MISTRPLSIASAATAVWLVMFMAVPAARAQSHTPHPAAAPSRPADEHLGPIYHWHMEKKTDALSGESSSQPSSLKFPAGADGKLQGMVSTKAYCSRNGVSVFFLADVSAGDPNDFPGIGRGESKQHPRKFGTTGADEPGEPDDFTRTNVQRDVLHASGRATKVLEREDKVTRLALRWRVDVRHLATDH